MTELILPPLKPIPTKDRVSVLFVAKGNLDVQDEAIVNAVAHRDYSGNGDMIDRCRAAGLEEPEFRVTDGFVTVIHRKPGISFEAVGGKSWGGGGVGIRPMSKLKPESKSRPKKPKLNCSSGKETS